MSNFGLILAIVTTASQAEHNNASTKYRTSLRMRLTALSNGLGSEAIIAMPQTEGSCGAPA